MTFFQRLPQLPWLGLGVSTEYGADGLDILPLHAERPDLVRFLEIGVGVERGLDATACQWIARGRPVTYHFLDLNLEEPDDFDAEWLRQAQSLVARMRPAWVCGDAGAWHIGRRERGHMFLQPPVLCTDSAIALSAGIIRLRNELGREIFPENPPGALFLGELHILDFFAQVCGRADTGMLLDCSHLLMFQRAWSLPPLARLDAFPWERIVELHLAGGTEQEHAGFRYILDDHGDAIVPAVWEIFSYVLKRARNLRAVVFECERNPRERILPTLHRIAQMLDEHGFPGELKR